MTQDFMDAELFADFIIEAKEHLETIEPNLLELEKAPGNLDLLNEIFRPMHSLKGASGFLDLNKMNALAHKAENILDELRNGSMAVNAEIMDIILATTDALRHMIDSLEVSNTEGDMDTVPLMNSLDALMGNGGASPATLAPAANKPVGTTPSASTEQPPQPLALDVESWIEALQGKETYVLTVFGAEHLKNFVEEARENIVNIADSLLELEKTPEDSSDLINDTFRLFHNLKGNSGIIGYNELNSLTHEAETLLNDVRKGTAPASSALIDLLLLATDVLDALITHISIPDTTATPFDISELLEKLQQAVSGGIIEIPASLYALSVPQVALFASQDAAGESKVHAEQEKVIDQEEVNAFENTVTQQFSLIETAIQGMKTDGTDAQFSDAMYRSLKALQSACKVMGLDDIQQYAERTAGIVDQGRITELDFSLMADLLEQESGIISDMIKSALEKFMVTLKNDTATIIQALEETVIQVADKATSNTVTPSTPKAPAKAVKEDSTPKTSSTIRVDHEKLDHLMNLIGELIINRNRYSMLARQLEEFDKADIGDIAQNLSETTYAMARISDDLQDTIMKVRMVPVASVFSRFPRLIRDLSRKSGKEVELVVDGEDTELDKSVVEVIGDPLVHLIRNSVDHGIESAEVRRAAGKPEQGTVSLRAFYRGNSVAIEIEDDGKGIDPEKMRQVAIGKGILTEEDARLLDDREAMELIFAPGFSSAEAITDISGRGVGMDVVRTNIKNLKGSIAIQSEIGKGSTFTLLLPLTLAIIDALMVNVAGNIFAIPLDAVSETTKLEAARLTDVKGKKAVTLRNEVLGIVSLAELLGCPCNMANQEMLAVVVIQDNDRRLGLVVDSLLERQEVVIKPLGNYLGDLKGISGATIMGDGSVILILEPHEIYSLATSRT